MAGPPRGFPSAIRPGSPPLTPPHRPLRLSSPEFARPPPSSPSSSRCEHPGLQPCTPLPPWGSAQGNLSRTTSLPHRRRRHRRHHQRRHQDLKRQRKRTWARPSDVRGSARTRSAARQTPRPWRAFRSKGRDRGRWSGSLADQVIKIKSNQHQEVPCAVNSHARLAHEAMFLS